MQWQADARCGREKPVEARDQPPAPSPEALKTDKTLLRHTGVTRGKERKRSIKGLRRRRHRRHVREESLDHVIAIAVAGRCSTTPQASKPHRQLAWAITVREMVLAFVKEEVARAVEAAR